MTNARRRLAVLALACSLACVTGCKNTKASNGSQSTSGASTPSTSAPASLTVVAGDDQTARPGEAVPTAPAVRVTGADGSPLGNIEVQFAVTSGGGTVQFSSAKTDASGKTSPGTWTLGAKGTNALSASVAGLDPVTLHATAVIVSPDIQVSLYCFGTSCGLAPGQVIGEDVDVIVSISSTYEIASVGAQARDATTVLGVRSQGTWEGVLHLVGQPRGPVDLVISAYDVKGNETDLIVPVILDRRPQVALTAPTPDALARPVVHVTASCSDDDTAGCTAIDASIDGTVRLSGTTRIDADLDLSSEEGKVVSLVLTGIDSIGQTTSVSREVYVDSSAGLSLLTQVGGRVLDISGSRILYLDETVSPAAARILDTSTGGVETIETTLDVTQFRDDAAYLTPSGAIFAAYPGEPAYCWAYEWRDGGLTQLEALSTCLAFRVSGNYASYVAQSDPTKPASVIRRDLTTDAEVVVSSQAGNDGIDVAENGAVVYWSYDPCCGTSSADVHRWRDGIDTQLTDPAGGTVSSYFPTTDGTNVVYSKVTRSSGTTTWAIAMSDGQTETLLTDSSSDGTESGSGYQAAGGYVAYRAVDSTGVTQIWRHGPSGEQQLTLFGSDSQLDALAPDGTVFLSHGARLYRAVPGQDLQDIGSALGRVVFRDSRTLVLIGNAVLTVNP